MSAKSFPWLSSLLTFVVACTDPHILSPDSGPDDRSQGQDAGPGDTKERDGDGGEADPPRPRAFQDDFERADGPIQGGRWSHGSSGTAEIWAGRLCLADAGSAELALLPGQLRHFRIDVPGAVGLRIEVKNPSGTMFALDFREDVLTSSGAKVTSNQLFHVARLQADLDYDARNAAVGEREGQFVNAPFAGNITDEEATSIRFSIAAADSQANHAVCLDNLYVGPKPPNTNPFLDSPEVNPWVPDSRPDSRCITGYCGAEVQGYVERYCSCAEGSSCNCKLVDIAPCAVDCLNQHPSGTFSRCTSACARNAASAGNAYAPFACIDMMCGHEPQPLVAAPEPVTWPADGKAAPGTEYMAAWSDGAGMCSVSKWDPTGFPFHRSYADFEIAELEQLRLYAEPTHTRLVMNADFTEANGKLMVWQDDQVVEHMFPGVISWVEPSPSRRYIWVDSQGSNLLAYDGRLLYRRVLDPSEANQFFLSLGPPTYGPDEAYALFTFDHGVEQEVSVLHFDTGRVDTQYYGKPDFEEWDVLWTFDDGVVWRKTNRRDSSARLAWIGFDGQSAPTTLPTPLQLQRDAPRGMLAAEEGLFAADRKVPVRLATLVDQGTILAANAQHVLYAEGETFFITDAAGTKLGTFDSDPQHLRTETIYPMTVFPVTPERGMFTFAGDDGKEEFHAFELVGNALVTTPLFTLPPAPDGTLSSYRVSTRPSSSWLLLRSPGQSYMYEVETHQLFQPDWDPPLLADYHGQIDYYFYAPPPSE